jgi:acetolactate synthase-1/2/3 large subunit
MNGAQGLIKAAIASGIEICFANAGTTEIPIVLALDEVKGIRAVLGLFEGVCTGAADGYGRMKGKPAMTLLHLGPGFANGIANLHNARRAHTPILNIVGEHATWHREVDPPLAMEIEVLAGSVSEWCRTSSSAQDLPRDLVEALRAASRGRIATLIAPHDLQLAPWKEEPQTALPRPSDPVDPEEIRRASELLTKHKQTALLLGGRALRKEGLLLAAKIRTATGCDLLSETFPPLVERGSGLPAVTRIPYFPEQAAELLAPYEAVVLAGAREPVTFFGYPGIPGHLLKEGQLRVNLGTREQDLLEALMRLSDMLGRKRHPSLDAVPHPEPDRPQRPEGALTPTTISRTLAALQPEGAIIVDEGITSSSEYFPMTAGLPPHTILPITGGSIGYGLPCALGAALACPNRPVIAFQADGAALYTLQALWTMAREKLNVTVLLCSNRSYRILKAELERAGVERPGENAGALLDLKDPSMDWVKIAEGLGVEACSVSETSELASALKKAVSEPGPFLIEARLD